MLGANFQANIRRTPPPMTANMVGFGDFLKRVAGSIGGRRARGGRNDRRAFSPANRLFEIATSTIWNATARVRPTTFAPIPIVAGRSPTRSEHMNRNVRSGRRSLFRARIRMAALARNPVLPEAIPVGAISALLRRSLRRPSDDRPRPSKDARSATPQSSLAMTLDSEFPPDAASVRPHLGDDGHLL